MNNMSMVILCVSFLYSICLNILYFSKKHINTYETKMFSIMMVSNLIGIFLEFCCIFSIKFLGEGHYLAMMVNKIFLVYLLLFAVLFGMYAMYVALFDGTMKVLSKTHRKIILDFIIIYIIFSILIVILPLDIHNDGWVMYSSGPAANVVYFIAILCTLLCIIMMAIKYKTIKKKKTIPLFAYILGGGLTTIIQNLNPAFTLATSMETFLIFLMFHTIENPDIKLINELNLAKDAADKANKAKSEFLSSMSHEIRTPLNAIVGFSQALSEEDLPESARDEVNDIVMASNGLLEIVNGILDISKIEANKIEIINNEYNFKDLYNSLLSLTKARLGEKPLEIRTSYDETIPNVLYGDHSRIKQVILNILTNSIKYTKQGYIDFKVSSIINGDICRLIISVEDSGIGIKQENISKLFSKFERFDLEKNITIEGTGLGLAITKKLVELMNGTIVVQSVYGKGSKFTIAIDQRIINKENNEVINELEEINKNIDVTGKKVLIVDDNKINLKVAARLLEGFKLEIETVESGLLCIQKIASGANYDLILMDDMMPKMSGVETLHKLKEDSNFSIPVVALTANAISGMREKYINEGFDDYLAKPIDKEDLNKIVIKYLNK